MANFIVLFGLCLDEDKVPAGKRTLPPVTVPSVFAKDTAYSTWLQSYVLLLGLTIQKCLTRLCPAKIYQPEVNCWGLFHLKPGDLRQNKQFVGKYFIVFICLILLCKP